MKNVIYNVQGDNHKKKLNAVLIRNPDLKILQDFAKLRKSVQVSFDVSPLDARIYRFAPLVSADMKKVFSELRQIQTPQIMSLSIENFFHVTIGTVLYLKETNSV